MGKINLSNIQASLSKAKDAAAPLQNNGYTDNIPVEFIHLSNHNLFNETDTDETIQELADDIAACGLQHPIAVNKIDDENYRIISGERRYRAMTEYLHRKTIPCMVFENLSEEQERLRMFMANLAVREYTSGQKFKFFIEVKKLLEEMKESGEYKGGIYRALSAILNVTKRQIAKYSAIEKLSPEIQQQVLDGTISMNKAIELGNPQSKAKSDQHDELVDWASKLTDEQREKLLSGEIDLSSLSTPAEKDHPLVTSDSKPDSADTTIISTITAPVTTDDSNTQNGELVHHFVNDDADDTNDTDDFIDDSDNATSVENNQATNISEKTVTDADESDHFENGEPVHQITTNNETVHQSNAHPDNILFYKNNRYVVNDVQVLEENGQYTILKLVVSK